MSVFEAQLMTQPALSLTDDTLKAMWHAASTGLMHGPRCNCSGIGMFARGAGELERDIIDFLIAKYEERGQAHIVRLFESRERAHGPFLDWLERTADESGLSDDARAALRAEIFSVLDSMSGRGSGSGFSCG